MGSLEAFVIRLLLAIGLAVLIGRFFFQEMNAVKVSALALVMFGLAYLSKYLRKRDEEKSDER